MNVRARQPAVEDEASSISVSGNVTEAEWDGFVRNHPEGTIDHVWRWRTLFRDVFGHDSEYLAARRGGTVVGLLPLVKFRSRLFGRSLVSVPFLNYGGILVSEPSAVPLLLEHARQIAHQFNASHVELRHTRRQTTSLPHRDHKLQLRRPLPPSSDQLWSALDKKVRNQVRKAQKDGLVGQSGRAELVDEFYDVFSTNMRDLGTPVYSKRLFSETLRLFPQEARVFIVRLGKKPIAASITITLRDTALVPWASSLRAYRQHCPNMLLYWSMLEHSVLAGMRVFDFGRSTAGSGTHQFKVQWGAEERPMPWEYLLLTRDAAPDHGPQNPRFAPFIEAWKRLPVAVTRRIGPWIVSNIP